MRQKIVTVLMACFALLMINQSAKAFPDRPIKLVSHNTGIWGSNPVAKLEVWVSAQ